LSTACVPWGIKGKEEEEEEEQQQQQCTVDKLHDYTHGLSLISGLYLAVFGRFLLVGFRFSFLRLLFSRIS